MSDPYRALDERWRELLANEPATEPTPRAPRDHLDEAHRLATSAVGRERNHSNPEPVAAFNVDWVIQPTHVEVDPDAWRAAKAFAVFAGVQLAHVLGMAVEKAVSRGLEVERTAERFAERGMLSGRRAQHFARLRLVDARVWREFREDAVDADVSTARAVGIAIEQHVAYLRADAWTLL